jgi:hypothetical protein
VCEGHVVKVTRTHGRWEPHDVLFRTTTRADEAARKLLLSSTVVATHADARREPEWEGAEVEEFPIWNSTTCTRCMHTGVKRVAFATARPARLHSSSSNFVRARVGSLGLVEECGESPDRVGGPPTNVCGGRQRAKPLDWATTSKEKGKKRKKTQIMQKINVLRADFRLYEPQASRHVLSLCPSSDRPCHQN